MGSQAVLRKVPPPPIADLIAIGGMKWLSSELHRLSGYCQ